MGRQIENPLGSVAPKSRNDDVRAKSGGGQWTSSRLSGLSASETVTIRSTEAWEDEKPDIIHFAGDFELKASDWYLSADEATLYGKLDDPETVILLGSPALIVVNTEIKGRTQAVIGEAPRIVYQRHSNSIRMEGGATLTRAEDSMLGSEIEYDIEQDRFRAGGAEGVHFSLRGQE